MGGLEKASRSLPKPNPVKCVGWYVGERNSEGHLEKYREIYIHHKH